MHGITKDLKQIMDVKKLEGDKYDDVVKKANHIEKELEELKQKQFISSDDLNEFANDIRDSLMMIVNETPRNDPKVDELIQRNNDLERRLKELEELIPTIGLSELPKEMAKINIPKIPKLEIVKRSKKLN